MSSYQAEEFAIGTVISVAQFKICGDLFHLSWLYILSTVKALKEMNNFQYILSSLFHFRPSIMGFGNSRCILLAIVWFLKHDKQSLQFSYYGLENWGQLNALTSVHTGLDPISVHPGAMFTCSIHNDKKFRGKFVFITILSNRIL